MEMWLASGDETNSNTKTDTKRQPGTVLDGWNHTTTRRGEEEEDDSYVHLDDH